MIIILSYSPAHISFTRFTVKPGRKRRNPIGIFAFPRLQRLSRNFYFSKTLVFSCFHAWLRRLTTMTRNYYGTRMYTNNTTGVFLSWNWLKYFVTVSEDFFRDSMWRSSYMPWWQEVLKEIEYPTRLKKWQIRLLNIVSTYTWLLVIVNNSYIVLLYWLFSCYFKRWCCHWRP